MFFLLFVVCCCCLLLLLLCFWASPLHYAAEHGRVAAIEWLLRREANVAAVDVLGCSPLHVAARAGHVDCARTLAGVVGVDGLLFPSAPPPARNPKTLNFKIYY